jgi:zinc protease
MARAAAPTRTRSEAWADLGASFGGAAGSDRLSFSLRSLTDPELLDKAAELAARQLAEPALPEAVWRRERERLIALAQGGRHPSRQRGGQGLCAPGLPGPPLWRGNDAGHPDGHRGARPAPVPAARLRACDARVSLVGALNRAQADALVSRLLAYLPPALRGPGGGARGRAAGPGRTLALPFDSAQAHVFIGQPGIRRADPDYFPCWWAITFWAAGASSRA